MMTDPKTHCFTHHHMTMRQYGLWSIVRELQNKTGYYYFDADWLSENFNVLGHKSPRDGTSRDVIYSDFNTLLRTGWFTLLVPRRRKKDGTWESQKITALTHREWKVKYPDKCMGSKDSQLPQSDRHQSSQSNTPVAPERLTSRLQATNQLPQSNAPVAPERHKHESVANLNQGKPESRTNINRTNAAPTGDSSCSSEPKDGGSVSERRAARIPRTAVPPAGASEELWNDAETELIGYVIDGQDCLFEGVCDEA